MMRPHTHKCAHHAHEGCRTWRCYRKSCGIPAVLICGPCERAIIDALDMREDTEGRRSPVLDPAKYRNKHAPGGARFVDPFAKPDDR